MRPAYIPVGHIVNAHGIKGEVKLNPEGFTPEFVAEFDTLYINGEPVRVKSRRVHKSTLLLTLPGVEDMDAALALKGRSWTMLPGRSWAKFTVFSTILPTRSTRSGAAGSISFPRCRGCSSPPWIRTAALCVST